MWQLTWMLSLLPDWFWTLVLVAGILGTLAAWVLKFIPFVSNYKLPIQVGSILLLIVGVYFQGVIANEAKYQAEHERLEAEIKKQAEKAKELSDDLSKVRAERDAAIANKGRTVIKTIDRYIKGNPANIADEVLKEKNLSAEERKKLEAQIAELQKAEQECRVPSLLIEQVNSLTTRPTNEAKK